MDQTEEEYPNGTTLKLNLGDDNKDLVGYFRFVQATSAWKERRPNLLWPQEWGHGKNCTLYVFDNVASGDANGKLLNPQKEGNVRVQFHLNAALGHVVMVDSHHCNITVLYLCQDMFPPGKYAKTILHNAHYILAFKSARDQLGFTNLIRPAFPKHWPDVLDVYQTVTARPFGYVFLDLHPASDDTYRVFSDLLEDEGYTCAFAKPRRPT